MIRTYDLLQLIQEEGGHWVVRLVAPLEELSASRPGTE